MMNDIRMFALLSAVVLAHSHGLDSYQSNPTLRLTALLFNAPKPAEPVRLWLRIENLSKEPQAFCRSYWGYSLGSADPNGPANAEAEASIHGCGDRDHDPFWALLPGESRFDSFEIKGPTEASATLTVDVSLVAMRSAPDDQGPTQTISWKGQIADAFAAAEKLGFKKAR
jgi:hypothetical protein